MSQYTFTVDYGWVHDADDLNEKILNKEWETLTSADQIISIHWDPTQNAYVVWWMVRKWLGGEDR